MNGLFSSSRRFLAYGACLVAAIGCAKSDSQSIVKTKPSEQSISGGKQLTAAGISLTFPADWQTLDLTTGQFDRAAKSMSASGGGADMVRIAKTAAQSGMYKMFVFDPKGSKPGLVNNVNVVVTPGGPGLTLDQALAATKQQLAGLDPKISTSKATFPAGEFGRVDAHIKGPSGIPCATTSYMRIDGDNLTVVTFTCSSDQAKAYDEKAREIMKTFKRA